MRFRVSGTRRHALRSAAAGAVLAALSLVLVPTAAMAQSAPEPSCEGETTVVLVDASAETDLYAAFLLAEVLGTGCLVDAGLRTDSELPAASAALLDTAGLRYGYVVGGPAAVPAAKLTAKLVWRRVAGADRWATLSAVAAAAADPTALPTVEPAHPAPTGTDSVSGPRYSAVSAGIFHTCALQTDGTLACWGSHDGGVRRPSPPAGKFTQVSAAHDHTCGLRVDGTVACWGTDNWGLVSDAPAGKFTQVSAHSSSTCALRVDGTVACWGQDSAGKVFAAPVGEFTQVAAGGFHWCGLRVDGTVACWGSDTYGLVSDAPAGRFTQVSAGTWHACGVRAEGTVACWGNDDWGLVSDAPAGEFTQVSASIVHTCALRASGRVVCWGSDNSGWYDDAFTGQSASPSGTFTQVSAGGGHSCGLRTDGRIACWGADDDGQVSLSQPQIVAVYAVPDGVSAVDARPEGISDAVGAAQKWFRSQTGGRHPVFVGDGDGIDVRTVRLDPAPPNESWVEAQTRILREVRSALGLRGWESPAVWLEGRIDRSACAWASRDHVMVPIWNCGRNVPEPGTRWPDGGSYLIAHELAHLLGAAPICAPNVHQDDFSHVTDDPRDIIYRGPGSRPASGDYVLDVGRDDYFGHDRDDCFDISDNPLLRIE